LFHECDIIREIDGDVYRIRNRNQPKLFITVSHFPDNKKLKAVTICQACHSLNIQVPDEVKHAEEIVIYIRDNDFKDQQ
jgi:hypothetical protein